MQHKNRYPVWPNGWHKKESGLGPLSGTLIEEYDTRYVFDPQDLTDAGNPWGLPNFLWIDDGAGWTLSSNASLDMSTVVGTVTNGSQTPYQYPDGSTEETCQYHAADSYRYDNTHALSWTVDDDVVFFCKFRLHDRYTASTQRYDIFCTAPHGDNFTNFMLSSANNLSFNMNDASLSHACTLPFTEEVSRRTWHTAIAIVDRSATRMYGSLDGSTPGAGTFDGVINNHAYNGIGVCLGARMPGGAVTYPAHAGLCIAWIGIWTGADLYEAWSANSYYLTKRLSFESLGLRETVASPTKVYSYARPTGTSPGTAGGGTSYIDHHGVWRFSDFVVPAAGNPLGALMTGLYYNRAASATSHNFDPPVTTGWTATGGVFSLVDDTAALAAANASIWGPNVFSFANATGSAQRVYMSGGTNCTVSACHFHLLARYTAGSGATMGWRDTSDGSYTSVGTILDNYALTAIYNQTPGGTDWKFCIEIPDGCTLLFIGQSLNNNTVANPCGVNKYPQPYSDYTFYTHVGTASYWRYADKCVTQYTPVATSGTFLINTAPAGWGGSGIGADALFLSGDTTAGDILHAESAAPGWATSDGTTQISTGAPVDGTYMDVWSAWQGALQYVQQGIVAVPVTGAYDGNKGCVGVLKTGMANPSGGDYWVKTIQVRQI